MTRIGRLWLLWEGGHFAAWTFGLRRIYTYRWDLPTWLDDINKAAQLSYIAFGLGPLELRWIVRLEDWT